MLASIFLKKQIKFLKNKQNKEYESSKEHTYMVWLMITSIFLMILILILISPISTQIQATITETEQFFAVKVFFYGICLYTKKKKITLGNQDNIWVLLENIKTQGINQIKLNKIDVQDLWRDILQVLDKVKVQQFSWK